MRDRAYFALVSHSGDRGGDLSLLSSDRLYCLPREEGIFVSQTIGKTFSIDNPNNFILYTPKDPDICPIRHLKEYIEFAKSIQINLTEGCLFRIRDKKTKLIINKPMDSSLETDRLRAHLSAIGLYEGETSHSTRRGCAITLRMLGVNDDNINAHIGWGRGRMVDHYAGIADLYGPRGAARQLSDAAQKNTLGSSELVRIDRDMSNLHSLKRFHFL